MSSNLTVDIMRKRFLVLLGLLIEMVEIGEIFLGVLFDDHFCCGGYVEGCYDRRRRIAGQDGIGSWMVYFIIYPVSLKEHFYDRNAQTSLQIRDRSYVRNL